MDIKKGLSYDDVLLVPKYSTVWSRRHVNLKTKLTRNVSLNVPLVSANMDTITESEMAIAMALEGGIGVIHQFMPIEDQAAEVRKVKRAMHNVIESPYTIADTSDAASAISLMKEKGASGILVVDKDQRLSGVITKRDILFQDDLTKNVSEFMTKKERLITSKPGTSIEDARNIFMRHKIEKLPLVDDYGRVAGLITTADLVKKERYPNALLDSKGRLMVAAAIGVKEGFMKRAMMLLDAGVDCIVVDIAHGHSELALNTVRELKKQFPSVDVLAGNIATADAAKALIDAGADGLKVGVGPGAACITRIVAGSGVPQVTAIMDCARIAREFGIPICADGGTKNSGDLAKALAAGAHSIMMGSLLAGTSETPGTVVIKEGKRYKIYRGSASLDATISRQIREQKSFDISEYTPEGVEKQVPHKGPVKDVINRLLGGLRSGVSYCGASDVIECQDKAEFIQITAMGMNESRPHDTD